VASSLLVGFVGPCLPVQLMDGLSQCGDGVGKVTGQLFLILDHRG
jgi:hypothetical protein